MLNKWHCSYALLKLHSGFTLTASEIAHIGSSFCLSLFFLLCEDSDIGPQQNSSQLLCTHNCAFQAEQCFKC